jgi:3-hydroxyisobutyrate dehydrogenase
MGAPMAANLVKAGHVLKGFDPVGVAIAGVEQAQSARDAVAALVALLR